MSVIKEEYLQDRITRTDLLPLSFLKKSVYTGSRGILRYRIEKTEEGEGDEKIKKLLVSAWTTPFAFDKTPEKDFMVRDFPFTDEALDLTAVWLDNLYQEKGKK